MPLWVKGGRAFAGDPAREVKGELWLEDGEIRAVPADATTRSAEVLDASGCLVLPGFVIAHHHLYSTLARGMPGPSSPPRTFVEILEKIWWRLDRALDRELVELSGLLGAHEALACGVTGIVDHHASPTFIEGSLDVLASGVAAAGARSVLCYEATNRHGRAGFEAGLAENSRFALDHGGRIHAAGPLPLVAAMVGGHAPFTLDDDELASLAEVAHAHEVAVHIHVAEAAHDQDDARRRGAPDVTERLRRAGILEGRSVVAHGVHLARRELDALLEAGAWLTHQPRSNMNNRVGYLRAAETFSERLALGTDGINGDLFDEAHAAFFRLREAHDAGAERVWSWLAGGWRLFDEVFGLPRERGFGTLAAGAPADLIVLDYDGPTEVHEKNLPWHLCFGMSARHVRDVVVAGRFVVRDRRPASVEQPDLRRMGTDASRRLWSRMASLA